VIYSHKGAKGTRHKKELPVAGCQGGKSKVKDKIAKIQIKMQKLSKKCTDLATFWPKPIWKCSKVTTEVRVKRA